MSNKEIGWIRAIDEDLVSLHLGVASEEDSYEEAKRKLKLLIKYNIEIVNDLSVKEFET